MEADYTIHSGWGHHIEWMDNDFSKVDFNKDTIRVYGHLPKRPKAGQTLMGEFQKSWMKFEFVNVEYCRDPDDMFFADVKAIKQVMK